MKVTSFWQDVAVIAYFLRWWIIGSVIAVALVAYVLGGWAATILAIVILAVAVVLGKVVSDFVMNTLPLKSWDQLDQGR